MTNIVFNWFVVLFKENWLNDNCFYFLFIQKKNTGHKYRGTKGLTNILF